jgi:hypothetical protein
MDLLCLVLDHIGKLSENVVVESFLLANISCSRENFDLVQLKNNPPWALAPESKVTLTRAHGSEIVRSFCFLDSVGMPHLPVRKTTNRMQHKTVLTAGEDGQVKAWRGE